ncbi:hypothetical protein BGZ65_012336, partial [Modicella reniformis]
LAPVRNDAVKALPDEQPLWPIPRSFTYGKDKVLLSHDFQFNVQSASNGQVLPTGSYPVLEKAIVRCQDRFQIKRSTAILSTATATSSEIVNTFTLSELIVIVEDAQATLEYGVAESYTIHISGQDDSNYNSLKQEGSSAQKRGLDVNEGPTATAGASAILTARTQWGVIHGLETFLQLVQAGKPPSSESLAGAAAGQTVENRLEIPNAPWMIQDEPLYSHRGILLDTSRNYFPVKDIIRTLDAMSIVKLNVFHWHVLDQQTYPLVSRRYPDLSAKGAERPDYIYTPEDVVNIIKHGEERGIRVLPEFDTPGHTASWGRSYPNITVCLDEQPHSQYAAEPPAGQLDPLQPFTYTLLDGLIKEWGAQFPDSQVHAGGDEVNFKCWRTSERLRDYISNPSRRAEYEKALPPVPKASLDEDKFKRTKSGSQSGEDRLLEVYLDRALGMFLSQGKRPIVWEELALEHNVKLPESVIVQVWKSASNAKRVIEQGRPVILSSAEFWYLDCGAGQWLIGAQKTSWCSYSSWQRIYSYKLNDQLNAEQQKLVYGGEVCMWSEQTSPSNLDPNLWPRSAAAAEVLWSGPHDDQGQERPLLHAAKRLVAVREQLVQIGVAAAPMFPSWCSKNLEGCLAV